MNPPPEETNQGLPLQIGHTSKNEHNSLILNKIIEYQIYIFYINLAFTFFTFTGLIYYGIRYSSLSNVYFILNQISKYVLILIIQYIMALLVKYREVKVNYTRKVVHISYFVWPQLLDKYFLPYQTSTYIELWNIWIIITLLVLMSEPIRFRCGLLQTFYIAVDRPEDSPYTLIWFSTQIISTLFILIPFSYYFKTKSEVDLIFIPILINGLADGLAEPIGVRFGRHKYKTRALCGNREYTRSYEGSLCVYLVSLIICLAYYSHFSLTQYGFVSSLIPIASTLTEAFSPHTWDSPLIFLVVCILLTITLQIK